MLPSKTVHSIKHCDFGFNEEKKLHWFQSR